MPIEINDNGEIIELSSINSNHLLRSTEVTELISEFDQCTQRSDGERPDKLVKLFVKAV